MWVFVLLRFPSHTSIPRYYVTVLRVTSEPTTKFINTFREYYTTFEFLNTLLIKSHSTLREYYIRVL
jgi:hypothetical protein